jgi:uncharacterized protein (TIGR00725 family)
MPQLVSPIPVAVIGSSKPNPENDAIARDIGGSLAERGHTVICGGRQGVMAAAAEGCSRAGGLCIGILPNLGDSPNNYCSVIIATDLGSAGNPICEDVSRNRVIVRAALCIFAIGGEMGTANELRFAWEGGKYVFGLGGAPAPEGYTRKVTWEHPSRRFLECKSAPEALTAFDAFLQSNVVFSTTAISPRR